MAGTLLALFLFTVTSAACAAEPIHWSDGSWDETGAPDGALLSDNPGWWGRSVFTGVSYFWETPPDNPRDILRGNAAIPGRRLLDGDITTGWHRPVGTKGGRPLVAVFDFKRPCAFSEIDIFSEKSPTAKAALEVSDDGTNWMAFATATCAGRLTRVRPDTPGRGRHLRLTFRSTDSSSTYLDEVLVWGEGEETYFFTHTEPKYRMRDDHVLLENGQPFFPFGFYNVSWTIPAEERLAMVRDVAKWGYNAVHVGMRSDEYDGDGYGAFLDACAKLGIRVITEFAESKAESVVRKYRGKAAVMGWNPGDEPAPKGITPQEMFRRYDTFKQIDPDHIAYTVICVPSQYANYAAGTDVLAPDPYPVPRAPVDVVYRRFKEAKAAANKVDTALWAVGQAFGGQKYDQKGSWPRWPDPREFRGMSYLSLMAGAKGIIYYTYYDGSFDIRQAPDLLEAVQKFPAEMRDMVPFILDGKGELLAEDADGVYAMVWTLGAERRLVVVNARDKEAKVDLPFSGTRVLQGAPQGLKVVDGKVRFTLAPLERVVLGWRAQ